MPISTTCTQCSRKLRVPDELVGKRVKCPNCNFTFTVTADEAPVKSSSNKVSTRKAPPPPEPDYEEVPEDEDTDQQEPEEEPPPEEEPEDQDDQEEDDEPRRRKKKKKRRGRRYSGKLEPHRGQLVMILGIAGLALFLFGGGVGFPLGIVAWILGNNDLKAMQEGRMDPEGEGQTSTGRICGMITTILGIVSLAGFVLIFCVWLSCFGAMFAGSAGAGAGGF